MQIDWNLAATIGTGIVIGQLTTAVISGLTAIVVRLLDALADR